MKYKWLKFGILGTLLACSPVSVDMDLDKDEDGLLTSEEEALGTDPDNPDSDGDGHSDGSEVNSGIDPLNEEDHPYFGNYPVSRCDPAVEGTGYAVGDVSNDFELMDQFGEMIKLSDFCENVVVLVAAAFW